MLYIGQNLLKVQEHIFFNVRESPVLELSLFILSLDVFSQQKTVPITGNSLRFAFYTKHVCVVLHTLELA